MRNFKKGSGPILYLKTDIRMSFSCLNNQTLSDFLNLRLTLYLRCSQILAKYQPECSYKRGSNKKTCISKSSHRPLRTVLRNSLSLVYLYGILSENFLSQMYQKSINVTTPYKVKRRKKVTSVQIRNIFFSANQANFFCSN